MLMQPTIEKLYNLRLGAMALAYQEQQTDAQVSALSFEERFSLLIEAEHASRDNRRIKALLKDAELRIPEACIEDFEASPQRGIDKATVRQMQSCAWVDQNLNVLITGMTGAGKSCLACALGQAACRRGLRVSFRRVSRLFDELALAKADGTYTKVLRKLGRAQLDGVVVVVTRLFVQTVQGFYAKRTAAHSGGSAADAKTGAVTVVQRTSSDLKLNPHLHVVLLDGAYHEQSAELTWASAGTSADARGRPGAATGSPSHSAWAP
jgi:hypothetical protein